MNIFIVKGVGTGPTKLSAFDDALLKAGIANYNLIYLSSIIPRYSNIINGFQNNNPSNFGNKAFVVIAKNIITERNQEAWAGLGWVQDETKKGLFVEHLGSSKQEIDQLITSSLSHMKKIRQGNYGSISIQSIGIKCTGMPVCSLVAAFYGSEAW